MRLLELSSVQKSLALTVTDIGALSKVVRALPSNATEDQAFGTVAVVLTKDQSAKLLGFLVTDLGYLSLEISDVRAKLSLTADQTKSITTLTDAYSTVRSALASGAANQSAAQTTLAAAKTKTSTGLAAVLTEDQDKALRALAQQP